MSTYTHHGSTEFQGNSLTFSLRTTTNVVLNSMTIQAKSMAIVGEEVAEMSVTFSCYTTGSTITKTVGESYSAINLDLGNYAVNTGQVITFELKGVYSISAAPFAIMVEENVDTNIGYNGIVNNSSPLPDFSLSFDVSDETKRWYIGTSTQNGGYPYFADIFDFGVKASIEISLPKPWWAWKITADTNETYPYNVLIGGTKKPIFLPATWYVVENGTLKLAIPYVSGVAATTYYSLSR